MNAQTSIAILEGDTFVVSDARGDIEASPTDTQGLFHRDTRFLSTWRMTVNGQRLQPLSTDDLSYFAAQFFLVPATGTIYVDAKLSVIRHRAAKDGFFEEIAVLNHAGHAVDVEVRIEAGADFADLFEVKDALKKKGEHYQRVEGATRLVLGYRRERFVRETWIESDAPAAIVEGALTFRATIAAHGEWRVHVGVRAVDRVRDVESVARATATTTRAQASHAANAAHARLDAWIAKAPRMVTSSSSLARTYEKSLVDLAALRFFSPLAHNDALPAAGLPWFMAVFGRDSIITSYQALPFFPELARTALYVLGLRQGTQVDHFRDEEPGKILHEARWGELTAFEERPHSPYFGSADATPLWLVLLEEYTAWTGDEGPARELERHARAALQWIDAWGDRDGDGYIEYDRRNVETGLENQCWKDSFDSIAFADGTLAKRPIATCEIQGYAYDAKVRCARLARAVWNDDALADRLEREAAVLKKRFNEDFWIADRRFFALALDKDKRRVDSLTSNIGHLLWSGIVDDDKVEDVARHLLSPALFSGWGVRTMAEGEGSYNPIGYHVGTVWPHDNSIIAMGLRRAGYRADAARIALGILDAAEFFRHRLPEAFAGYERTRTKFPVEYPTACSPQAWATGAPLLLLRVLLGLDVADGRLLVDPAVPASIAHLGLLDVPGVWGRADAFARGRLALGAPATAATAVADNVTTSPAGDEHVSG